MSKCWRCNKEFYNPHGNNTLCDECIGRQPKTTTVSDYTSSLSNEIQELKHELEVYKRALELVCEDLQLYEDVTSAKYKEFCYLGDARKELKMEELEK